MNGYKCRTPDGWYVFVTNGGLVTETHPARSRLNCGQMSRLECWRVDFGRWKTTWSASSRRWTVEFDGCKETVGRKSKDQGRRNLGLRGELLRLGMMFEAAT